MINELSELRNKVRLLYIDWQTKNYVDCHVDYAEGISQCLCIIDNFIRKRSV